MRDLDKNPYSLEEGRVCDYFQKLTPDIGCGDDPIGFLIAAHAAVQLSAEEKNKIIDNLTKALGHLTQHIIELEKKIAILEHGILREGG